MPHSIRETGKLGHYRRFRPESVLDTSGRSNQWQYLLGVCGDAKLECNKQGE